MTFHHRFLPALLRFPEEEARQDGWGRLLSLRPDGARLLSRFRLEKGAFVRLSFETAGEELDGLSCAVASCGIDEDGWQVADVRFVRAADRARLGRVLHRLLSSR